MYHPGVGRFLSRDPIGFEGGDENLYRYVKNGPTNAVDPTGLAEQRTLVYDGKTMTLPAKLKVAKDKQVRSATGMQIKDQEVLQGVGRSW